MDKANSARSPEIDSIDPPLIVEGEYIRASDAAKLLSISVDTWWQWVKDKIVPPGIKLSDGVTVWKREDIDSITTLTMLASNEPPHDGDGYMRAAEIAKYFSIGANTWWRWVRYQVVPPGIKLSEGVTVWKRSDIQAWAASRGIL
ncbi:helix-turn-helix transcriptional regulator [Aurantivibrio plasticivorans]